jgi:large subunit ribosomal protein L21
MYAVIRTGGKQYRVEQGQRLDVERLEGDDGSELELAPVLFVDGDRVLATPDQLGGVSVRARIVERDRRGPKITGFKYKPKTNQRRRWGHRQGQSRIEITGISAGRQKRATPPDASPHEQPPDEKAPAKKAPAQKATTKKAPAQKAPTKKAPVKKAPASKGTD